MTEERWTARDALNGGDPALCFHFLSNAQSFIGMLAISKNKHPLTFTGLCECTLSMLSATIPPLLRMAVTGAVPTR
jgi:hypothetical protein